MDGMDMSPMGVHHSLAVALTSLVLVLYPIVAWWMALSHR